MKNILDKIKNTRVLAAIGVICLFLGTIFTYVKFTVFGYSTTISLIGYWEGKIVMVLAVANLLLIFKDIVEKYVPQLFATNLGRKLENVNSPKASLIPTILSVVFVIYLHSTLSIDSSYASYGLGFYLLWLGAICLVIYGILNLKKKETINMSSTTNTVNYSSVNSNSNAMNNNVSMNNTMNTNSSNTNNNNFY